MDEKKTDKQSNMELVLSSESILDGEKKQISIQLRELILKKQHIWM